MTSYDRLKRVGVDFGSHARGVVFVEHACVRVFVEHARVHVFVEHARVRVFVEHARVRVFDEHACVHAFVRACFELQRVALAQAQRVHQVCCNEGGMKNDANGTCNEREQMPESAGAVM